MKRWMTLFVALLLAGCADPTPTDAPDDGLQDVDPSRGLGAISGVVVSEVIVPIEGAVVTLLGSGQNTTTGPDGTFVFNDLEPGFYPLSASAPGFETSQSTADVVADSVAKVKVALPIDRSPQPFHDTISHNGFIDYSPGIAGFVLEVLLDGTLDFCDCSFEFDHEETVKTYVYEAFYDETIVSPVQHRGYYWELWMFDPEVDGQTGYGHSPINVHLDAGFYAGATTLEARLTGPDEWLAYQQDFEIHVTRFHLEPAPEGWTLQDA